MTFRLSTEQLASFVPAEKSFRRAVSDCGIRGVSSIGALANRVLGPRNAGHFGILLYHRIAEKVSGITSPTINVPPEQFERQIRGLIHAGFVFWPLQRILKKRAAGEPVPQYVTVLTFDDCFENVYRNAWPLLRELNIPATLFLPTAYLGSDEPFPFDHWGRAHASSVPSSAYRPMTVEQCREMADSGLIEFGAHTHSHEDFRGRPEEFRSDLDTNITLLRETLGVEDVSFAFPYGTPRLGFSSEDLTQAALDAGVQCALTTHSSLVGPNKSPFAWGRFTVFPWDSAATIAGKLTGWYEWAPELKNRLLGQGCVTSRRRWYSHRDRETFGLPLNTENKTTVSIIVPTQNRAEWLGDALRSLCQQKTNDAFEYEIVVCDNASTDETAEVVEAIVLSSDVVVRYCHQSNPGDAPTRNRALQEAKGEWIAFFDDDQLAPSNWLYELFVAAIETDGNIIGGAVELDLTEQEYKEHGGFVREALRETDLYSELQPYVEGDLPGTGNALVARSVIEAIGNFDESFVRGGSDYDFFSRARAAGFTLWYTPHSVIRHRVDPSRLSPKQLRLDALSGGSEHAEQIDFKQNGLAPTLFRGTARIVQAFFVHGPLLLSAWLRHDRGEVLGRRIRLWRTEGYVRKCTTLVATKSFLQRARVGTRTQSADLASQHGLPHARARS